MKKKWLKLFLICFVVGLLEILLVVFLHSQISGWNIVVLYFISTVLGIMPLVLSKNSLKQRFKFFNRDGSFSKLQRKSILDWDSLSKKELAVLGDMIVVHAVFISVFMLLIPGLLTDLIGVLYSLLVGIESSQQWYIHRQMMNAKKYSKEYGHLYE